MQRIAHGWHIGLPEEAFTVTGKLSFLDALTDSGNTVSLRFCLACGSAVYSTNAGMPGLVLPRASSPDDPEVFKPQMNVYAKRAPSWDQPDTGLPTFDGAPRPEGMPRSED